MADIQYITEFHPLVHNFGLWANRPANPFNGQKYTATDRSNKEYFWGTTAANWLSTQQYIVEMKTAVVDTHNIQATFALNYAENPVRDRGCYIEKATWLNYTYSASNTPTNSTNYWHLEIFKANTSNVGTQLVNYNNYAQSTGVNVWIRADIAINTVYAANTDAIQFFGNVVKVGSPGGNPSGLYCSYPLVYLREVG